MRTAFVVARYQGLETVFMVGQWTEDESGKPMAEPRPDLPLLAVCGWGHGSRPGTEYAMVIDLRARKDQGGIFRLGGSPEYDLHKRGLRVSCLWERFLAWLYSLPRPAEAGPGWLIDILEREPLVWLEHLPTEAEEHLSEVSRKVRV